MGERNASSFGFISRNFLFFLLAITSILFSLSWFFVLRSAGSPHFVDHSLLSNSAPPSVIDNGSSKESKPKSLDHVKNSVQEEELPQKKKDIKCNKNKKGVLKVYMYDLPPQFHFELLDWKSQGGSVWPDIRTRIPHYPGGLNLQHSIEYWLTLDLLASELPDNPSACGAIRVHNSSGADIIFVPFFSSLSYNKYSKKSPQQNKINNKVLQEKVVRFVTSQKEWKRSGGRDHLIVAHHPNSMLDARTKLWPAMFLLADFGRYPPHIANVDKDVIAPYKHMVKSYVNDTSEFDSRPILLYFQGAIYRKDVSALPFSVVACLQ